MDQIFCRNGAMVRQRFHSLSGYTKKIVPQWNTERVFSGATFFRAGLVPRTLSPLQNSLLFRTTSRSRTPQMSNQAVIIIP